MMKNEYDMDFVYPTVDVQARHAYRIRVPGLLAMLKGNETLLSVRDISATGVALYMGEIFIPSGSVVKLDLILAETPVLTDIEAEMVREVDDGVMAFRFADLGRKRELTLDKLVLETQKMLIQRKKGKSEEEENQEPTPDDIA